MTLQNVWDLCYSPLYDADAPDNYKKFHKIEDYQGHISPEILRRDAECIVEFIKWHPMGIMVKYFKETPDGEDD